MANYLGSSQFGRGKPYQEDCSVADKVVKRWDHNDGKIIYIEREYLENDIVTREKTLATWANRHDPATTWIALYADLSQLEG